MKKVLSKIRAIFLKLSITSQMAIYCFLLFALTFFLSSVLNQEIYKNISLDQANKTVAQSLYLIDENINNVINAINETSKSIISNSEVRAFMNSVHYEDNVSEHSEVKNFIRNILDNVSYASSVHLFKSSGGVMNISIRMINYPISINIEKAPWYEKVSNQKGDYSLIYNGGGFFNRTSNHDFIAMVRLFNDIETQECTGVQITNFSTETLKTAFKNLVDEYGMQVVIFDDAGKEIVTSDTNLNAETILQAISSSSEYVINDIDGSEYMISSRENSYGWSIAALMPMKGITSELYRFSYITLIFILVNGLLMFFGVSFFSRLVTHPINQLVSTMERVKSGQLEKVSMRSGNREITLLMDGYNVMVNEINELFNKVVKEQETIRKSELQLLQSQIKPHFLYNTFDAISSLALMNKSKEVYEAMLALGSLYRTNLNSGNEVIKIGEEIEAIKNYIKILKIRYDDTFDANIQVDERASKMQIPKLTLQPIVENALYHGIKPKGEHGDIDISVQLENGDVVIKIGDDGVGMSQETAEKIMTKSSQSFGIRGTVERLRIFYMRTDIMKIQTELGKGTTVILRLPAVTGEDTYE